MGRHIRNWSEEKSSDTPTAPHRYTWESDSLSLEDPQLVRKWAPYQPGDVLLMPNGEGTIRARVMRVFVRRNRHDDLVEYYRVQKETKAGYWSKMFTDVHPGQVQRAYYRAGLAPDIPKEAME